MAGLLGTETRRHSPHTKLPNNVQP